MRIRISDCEHSADWGNEQLIPLEEFIAEITDEPDDDELKNAIPKLWSGETVPVGGGSQPLLWLTLVD